MDLRHEYGWPSPLPPSQRVGPAATLALAALLLVAGCGERKAERPDNAPPARASQDGDHWQQIASVLTHPRCLNCHQVEMPLQGDGRPHIPRVERGPDNMGVAAMRCSNCHKSGNNQASGVPGAPHWSLAPESMNWSGLSTAELCQQLLDPKRNGGRTPDDLAKHMGEDPLVLWGWQPGADREPVPIQHDKFMEVFRAWVAAGTPCPQQEQSEDSA
ncbi:hypothetical protein [Microbulbifer sp. YPW16]|uniref:hypothetical protein n=1 Tax=Microbulbifer sp. YPW16 TaxID=2904242 RepID=UPI001E491629|nr:hypothetical protein [Microbulbifer sp. YPW16]UHQ56092.1 hypothetical protein LVE68_03670 [Microbulbifer sp. YPW16]